MPDYAKRVAPSIRMGEMDVCINGTLRALLGSCIGVALFDRRTMAGGLAHIVLPTSNQSSENKGKYADTAIPMLVEQINELVPGKTYLKAKLAGGANMFASDSVDTVGQQNLKAVQSVLASLRIPILAAHCGGTKGRRTTLDTKTGGFTIDVVGSESVTI